MSDRAKVNLFLLAFAAVLIFADYQISVAVGEAWAW
jgi:hypothetical protein